MGEWKPYLAGLAAVAAVLVLVSIAHVVGASWVALEAVFTAMAAAGTIVAAGSVIYAAREFDRREQERNEQIRRDRISRKPYLRVDVAFAEPEAHEENLHLTGGIHIYTAEELGIAGELAGIRGAVGPRYDDDAVFHLTLYVTNLQGEALGIADQVIVTLRAVWDFEDGSKRSEAFPVRLAYLASGQTTAVQIARVRRDIANLAVDVETASYNDLFQETMSDAHGAMRMYYTWDRSRRRAIVRNERKVQRSEEVSDSGDGRRVGRAESIAN